MDAKFKTTRKRNLERLHRIRDELNKNEHSDLTKLSRLIGGHTELYSFIRRLGIIHFNDELKCYLWNDSTLIDNALAGKITKHLREYFKDRAKIHLSKRADATFLQKKPVKQQTNIQTSLPIKKAVHSRIITFKTFLLWLTIEAILLIGAFALMRHMLIF